MLRYIRGAVTATHPMPEVIGVDDFALLRGKRYGTIIVDLDSHRPIELLPDRSAQTLAAWLKEYPSLRIISRDRSTEYERGIQEGAPEAVEVLDRWHLLKNLRESAERVLEHNHEALSTVRLSPSTDHELSTHEHTPEPRAAKERAAGEAARRKRMASYKKVKKLHSKGMNMLAICRTLGMSREPSDDTSMLTPSRSAAALRASPACSIPSNPISENAGKKAAGMRRSCGGR